MTPMRRELVLSASASRATLAELVEETQSAPGGGAGTPDGAVAPVANRLSYRIKLLGDRLAAAAGLLLLAPLMLLIAAAIRLESPGPALFSQARIGYRRRIFQCYKFRSMYDHLRDPAANRQATRDDLRVTPLGRLLRRTSLDELPQLLNVLKGEMSLVGPRPHAPETRAAGRVFHEIVPFYHWRHEVVPGITGWAQISGWRGETRTTEDIEMRVRYDLDYISRWSPGFDLKIIALTMIRVFHDDTAV